MCDPKLTITDLELNPAPNKKEIQTPIKTLPIHRYENKIAMPYMYVLYTVPLSN